MALKRPKKRLRRRRKSAKIAAGPVATTRYCDVVLKGGITSGVAYPLAMCELSKVFRFKNIGGTSTGAIAAAYTAAAEFSRQQGGKGFEGLEDLPQWFGGMAEGGRHSNLFCLFQPDRPTAPFFNVLAASLRGRRRRFLRLLNIAWALLRNFPVHVAIGITPGVAFGIWAALNHDGFGLWLTLGVAAMLTLGGLFVWLFAGLSWIVARRLPENNYGLCSGYAPRRSGMGPPLTQWVHETIADIADRDPVEDPPLTFGELWGQGGRADAAINLEMMTTSLTQGRPIAIPFEEAGLRGYGQYYFDPDEFRRLFPAEIVDWLVEHSRPKENDERFAPLLPMPKDKDLPVIVGVRLSLSYPFLLSAIPLYAIDYNRTMPEEKRRPERCWFSDGGVTSNFPVHFFDQPLPRWPTFAFNLREQPTGRAEEEIWMPRSNREQGVVPWHRFETDGKPSLIGFFNAIKEVGQTWLDNEQMRIPGYRDRIVHISLKPEEGGINLNMPGHVVVSLAERGRRAGKLLAERYVTGPKWDVDLNWENHRWVRYRSTMYALEELLKHLCDSYRAETPGVRTYADLIARELRAPPLGYPWRNEEQRKFALSTTEALVKLVESWTEDAQTFDKVDPRDPGAPAPAPELRIMPRH